MSLLNDMLRDLEQRQSPAGQLPQGMAGYQGLMAHSPKKSRKLLIGVGLSSVLLAATAAGVYVWQQRTAVPVPMLTEAAVPAQIPREAQVASVAALPAMAQESVISTDDTPQTEQTPPVLPEQQTLSVAELAAPEADDNEHSLAQADVMAPTRAPSASGKSVSDKAVSEKTVSEKTALVKSVSAKSVPDKLIAAQPKRLPGTNTVDASAAPASLTNASPVRTDNTAPVITKTKRYSPEELDSQAAAEARKRFAAGQLEAAVLLLQQQLAVNPNAEQSRQLLANHYFSDARYPELDVLLAPVYLQRDAGLRMLKARRLMVEGYLGEAIHTLEATVTAITENPDYHALLAALYQQQGRSNDAIHAYAKLLESHADMADWWAGMAIALDHAGNPGAARKAYERALQTEGLRDELAHYARQRVQQLNQAG